MRFDSNHIKNETKRLIVPTLIGVVVTVLFFSLTIFLSGIELLFAPFLLGLFLVGLIGVITIPVGIYKILKKIVLKKYLLWLIGIAIGFYLGLQVQRPIDSWDNRQRNINGAYIVNQIENYYSANGYYPDSLKQISIDSDSLSNLYKADRFGYIKNDSVYTLYIPVPIMDRWVWSSEKNEFEYDDF